jgi:predicted nucleic acid-binding protein
MLVALPIDEHVAQRWAQIMSIPGLTSSDNDAWVAASALAYGCYLASHDTDHTQMAAKVPGLRLIAHLSQ